MLIWQIAEERAAQVRAALDDRDTPYTVSAVEQLLTVHTAYRYILMRARSCCV